MDDSFFSVVMKNNSSFKEGSIFVANICSAPYSGKRLVIVIDTAPGLITVVPVRTSKLHRSRSTLIVPKGESAVDRKLSVDCGTIITIRRDALLRQVGMITAGNIEKIKGKLN